jgi:hypothetical protein
MVLFGSVLPNNLRKWTKFNKAEGGKQENFLVSGCLLLDAGHFFKTDFE